MLGEGGGVKKPVILLSTLLSLIGFIIVVEIIEESLAPSKHYVILFENYLLSLMLQYQVANISLGPQELQTSYLLMVLLLLFIVKWYVGEARRKLCAQSCKAMWLGELMLYYNPISLKSVMVWTSSARYKLIFVFLIAYCKMVWQNYCESVRGLLWMVRQDGYCQPVWKWPFKSLFVGRWTVVGREIASPANVLWDTYGQVRGFLCEGGENKRKDSLSSSPISPRSLFLFLFISALPI